MRTNAACWRGRWPTCDKHSKRYDQNTLATSCVFHGLNEFLFLAYKIYQLADADCSSMHDSVLQVVGDMLDKSPMLTLSTPKSRSDEQTRSPGILVDTILITHPVKCAHVIFLLMPIMHYFILYFSRRKYREHPLQRRRAKSQWPF